MLKDTAALIGALSALALPAGVIVVLLVWRRHFSDLLQVLIRRLRYSSDFEFYGIKIRGPVVTTEGKLGDNKQLVTRPASPEEDAARQKVYADQHKLMLVHTIRPTDPPKYADHRLVFDVSIFLVPHKNEGFLNDVRSVVYYMGRSTTDTKNLHGTKYEVLSGNDGFSFTAELYMPVLCIADVTFHGIDKHVTLHRYIDAEMAPVFRVPLTDGT